MLKSEPSNFADEEGRRHPVHGTTRLKIPAALLGKEKEESRFGSFEERRVDMSHKQHKMSDEDKAAWLLETRQGFEMEAVGSQLRQEMLTPQMKDCLSSEFDFGALISGSLGKVAGSAAGLGGPSDAATSVGVADAFQQGEAIKGLVPGRADMPNVASTQSSLWATIRDGKAAARKQIITLMENAALALASANSEEHGEVFITGLQERLRIAEHYAGLAVSVDDEKQKKCSVAHVEYTDPEMSVQECHDVALRTAINECELMPMESPDLMSSSVVDAFHAQVMSAKSSEDLSIFQEKWDNQTHLVAPLQTAVRQATKELNGEVKKIENKKKTDAREQLKKETAAATAHKMALETSAKKKIAHEKGALVFNLDFSSHIKAQRYETDAGFQEGLAQGGLQNSSPWVLASSEKVAKALTEENQKLKNTLKRWGLASVKQDIYKRNDVVTSPLLPSMGSHELDEVYEMCVPAASKLKCELPSLIATLSEWKLYTESATFCNYDCAPGFVASLRVQVSGITKYIMFPIKELIDGLKKTGCEQDEFSEVGQRVQALTAVDLKALQEAGCDAHHAELMPRDVLYIPAGWFAGATSASGEVIGLQRGVLLTSTAKADHQNLSALDALQMREATRRSFGNVQQVLEVEVAKQNTVLNS